MRLRGTYLPSRSSVRISHPTFHNPPTLCSFSPSDDNSRFPGARRLAICITGLVDALARTKSQCGSPK